ncbi:MAG: hypothetical protein QM597_07435 [Aeromicrobium sp.]|uniref:hypothetical protein n=1 Tax=Aeromicrobium sp. TaxID=1871063 RepID=UPI0039E5BBE7
MNAMIGADVDALRQLATQFDQAADRLRAQAGQVSNGVQVSAWVGPVAVRFRADWDSTHSVALKNAAEELAENATVLRQNAAQQEAASTSLSGTAGSSVVASGATSWKDTSAPWGEVTADDYLQFSKAAYDPSKLPDGWQPASGDELKKLGIDPGMLHTKNGLDAVIATDGKGHYVLIFRGSTEHGGAVDWWRENARAGLSSGAVGSIASQGAADLLALHDPGSSTEEAMNLALALKNAVGTENMTATGHSLGGRHAAVAGLVTGSTAVTFNAAGVTNDDLLYARTLMGKDTNFGQYVLGRMTEGGALKDGIDTSRITNYTTSGDLLTFGQKYTSAYDAIGRQVEVDGPNHDLESFDGKLR